VVEAQACGAPVIAADNSSLRELVGAEARFDATDVASIAAAMERALTDETVYAGLLAEARKPPPTWADVADRTAAVYRDLIDRDRPGSLTPGWRSRPSVAVVSPLPPIPHPAATYGSHLALALEAAGADVDEFADGSAISEPPSIRSGELRPRALPRMDRWRGGYDLIVCCIGNGPLYTGALELLSRADAHELPIAVVAHQVRLPELFQAAARVSPDGSPEADLGSVVHAIYPGLPGEVGGDGRLEPSVVLRHGLVFARGPIAAARRYLVPTAAGSRIARLDARPDQAGRVEVLPLVCPEPRSPEPVSEPGPARVVALVTSPTTHRPPLALLALAACGEATVAGSGIHLVVAGGEPSSVSSWREGAAELGLEDRVTYTADVPAAIGRATVALLLDAEEPDGLPMGIGDCLAAGTPVVVADTPMSADLGPGIIRVTLPADPGAAAARLAGIVVDLATDPAGRAELSAAGRSWAADHGFGLLADLLIGDLNRRLADQALA
jgi:glycosyltransferase involved in cell wall biosynthesis